VLHLGTHYISNQINLYLSFSSNCSATRLHLFSCRQDIEHTFTDNLPFDVQTRDDVFNPYKLLHRLYRLRV